MVRGKIAVQRCRVGDIRRLGHAVADDGSGVCTLRSGFVCTRVQPRQWCPGVARGDTTHRDGELGKGKMARVSGGYNLGDHLLMGRVVCNGESRSRSTCGIPEGPPSKHTRVDRNFRPKKADATHCRVCSAAESSPCENFTTHDMQGVSLDRTFSNA